MAKKTRTITLTGRRPVKIVEDDWSVLAEGQYSDHDGQVSYQANRTWTCTIKVRAHGEDDGRHIVNGVYLYSSHFQGEPDFGAKAGYLLNSDAELVEHIERVKEDLITIVNESEHERASEFIAHIREAARECIADLPAEEIV